MDIRVLITLAKRGAGNEKMSDAELGRRVGLQRGTFRTMQVRGFSDNVAMKLAQLAGVDPAACVAQARAVRARAYASPELLAALERVAARSWSTADRTAQSGLRRRVTDQAA